LDLHSQDTGITNARIVSISVWRPTVTHWPVTKIYAYLHHF